MSVERPIHVVVMGVSGSGKSVVAAALGRALGLDVIEGDDHHPAANVAKMAAGEPLTDENRWPWLETLARIVRDRHERGRGTVLACSALKRRYRDVLRAAVPPGETFVIELDVDAETLRDRMATRSGHFMPTSLLASQLATLEPLDDDERGTRVDGSRGVDEVIAAALAAMRSTSA